MKYTINGFKIVCSAYWNLITVHLDPRWNKKYISDTWLFITVCIWLPIEISGGDWGIGVSTEASHSPLCFSLRSQRDSKIVVTCHPWGIRSKVPTGSLKPQMAPNPMDYDFSTHTHLEWSLIYRWTWSLLSGGPLQTPLYGLSAFWWQYFDIGRHAFPVPVFHPQTQRLSHPN